MPCVRDDSGKDYHRRERQRPLPPVPALSDVTGIGSGDTVVNVSAPKTSCSAAEKTMGHHLHADVFIELIVARRGTSHQS